MTQIAPLHFKGDRSHPTVRLDIEQEIFQIYGISIPENAIEFFTPVISWIKGSMAQIPDNAVFSFCLSYFNSSSLKAIYMALQEIKKGIEAGKKIQIEWYVEEDDEFMADAGETFSDMIEVPFKVVIGTLE